MQKFYNSGADLLHDLANVVNGNAELPDHSLRFDDILIKPHAAKDLKDLSLLFTQSQVRDRSAIKGSNDGLIAVFEGPSFSTKLMVTDLIAQQAGVETTTVRLSEVVSKYIGETEKNLNKIFEAARQSGNILLFDEAEALFGKRTEVSDAHDKYANKEIDYFLDRVKDTTSLHIVSAKRKGNLDDAFIRRVRTIVSFDQGG